MPFSMRTYLVIVWAFVLCVPALLMPYRVRLAYTNFLAALAHAPFRAFGKLARFLMRRLMIPMQPDVAAGAAPEPVTPEGVRGGRVAVLFSGGTDSTCVAALMAEKYAEVHLLTFHEYATRNSPIPTKNIERLRACFPATTFMSAVFSVDGLVRHFSYENYFVNLWNHGWYVLATCGFSSLAWHLRTILYCKQKGITHVVDGLTRELMHFPGHMDTVIREFVKLYERHGITYENPVREWMVPRDQQFIDRVIVNRHSDFMPTHEEPRTTGVYLYERGIFPSPNVKGSSFDRAMQHDCYPFTLYNIFAFWGNLSHMPYELFAERIAVLIREKIAVGEDLLSDPVAFERVLARV